MLDPEPAPMVHPTSTQEVSEVLRAAAADGHAVMVRGRGTKLTWGRPPLRMDVVIDLSGMDQVLQHAHGELVASAQAGMQLGAFQDAVGAAGQRLSADETVAGASIGGTIATATSGPLRFIAGAVRDLLIGVTMVRADGVVVRAGGKVAKNVAGYDLCKLITGSFGTLGVVTEAIFRLHPLPSAQVVVTRIVDTPADAHAAVHTVLHSQLVPSGLEIDWPAGGPGTVAVLLEGTTDGVRARAETAARLLGPGAGPSTELPPWWAAYPWHRSDAGAVKIAFALSGLRDVLAAGVPMHLRGSAGVGVLYGALSDDGDPDDLAESVEKLRAICIERGGSAVLLDGPPEVKDAVDPWGPVPAIGLMRRVKDQFDPDHRLSPGRFVGGI